MPKRKLRQIVLRRDFCKGCRICCALCPKKVLDLDETEKVVAVRGEDCIACSLCELRCPDLAIEIEVEYEERG